MELGQIGIWRRHQEGLDHLAEIEALGYGTLWLGSSPSVAQARPFLEASSTFVVATGILNIWRHAAADVAVGHGELRRAFPGRFLLGIGVGHPEATSEYRRPLGAHPYFVPVEHTRIARETLGPGALLAPEVAVVVEADDERARERARSYAATYLAASNYIRNLERLGFTERDFADGGSDRLIDAVIPHGPAEAVAEAVRAHLDAGADHVCLQPLGQSVADYRALARALL